MGIPVVFLTNFFQVALIAMDKQSAILKIAIAGLVVNVAANWVLIPRLGSVGAALATVGVELLVFVFLFACFRKYLAMRTPWIELSGKFAVATSVSLALALLIVTSEQLFVRILVLNLAFIIMVGVVRLVDSDELPSLSWFSNARRRMPS